MPDTTGAHSHADRYRAEPGDLIPIGPAGPFTVTLPPGREPCRVIAIDPAARPDAVAVSAWRDATGTVHLDTVCREADAAAVAAYVRAGVVTRAELLELRGAASPHTAPLPFANWPEQGGTCAHVCGPDSDHRCAASANCQLDYDLPSGGTRSMPICAPCWESEMAAKEHAHG